MMLGGSYMMLGIEQAAKQTPYLPHYFSDPTMMNFLKTGAVLGDVWML